MPKLLLDLSQLARMRLRIVVRRTMVTVNFTLQGSASPK